MTEDSWLMSNKRKRLVAAWNKEFSGGLGINSLCQVCCMLRMSKMRGIDNHPEKNRVVVIAISGSHIPVT
jgi:hypothetical protein